MKFDKQINKDDKILATITANGNIVARINESQFSDIDSIIRRLRSLCNLSGSVRLFIRNFTRGWHLDVPLFISRDVVPAVAPVRRAVQLSLF